MTEQLLPIIGAPRSSGLDADASTTPTLRIGDLARRAGKSARAVRLYEEKGLLGPALRSEGGQRLYAEDALLRLGWIDKLQLLGLSLTDIRAFLDELDGAETGPAAMKQARQMFETKLREVRDQIRALASLA